MRPVVIPRGVHPLPLEERTVLDAARAACDRWDLYRDALQWAPAKEQNMRALMDALRAALDPDGVPR